LNLNNDEKVKTKGDESSERDLLLRDGVNCEVCAKTRENLSDSAVRDNVLGLLRRVRTSSKCIINKVLCAIHLR